MASPEEQADDDVIALLWLCERADIRVSIDRGKVLVKGVAGSPQWAMLGLLRPYKAAFIRHLNATQLNSRARTDIDEAFGSEGFDNG